MTRVVDSCLSRWGKVLPWRGQGRQRVFLSCTVGLRATTVVPRTIGPSWVEGAPDRVSQRLASTAGPSRRKVDQVGSDVEDIVSPVESL